MTRAWRPGPGSHWSLKVKEDVGNPETVSLPRPRPSKGAPWTNIQGQVIFNFWNILFHQSKSHDKSLTAWAGQPLVPQGQGGCGQPRNSQLAPAQAVKRCAMNQYPRTSNIQFFGIFYFINQSLMTRAWRPGPGSHWSLKVKEDVGNPETVKLAPAQAVKRCAMNQYPRTSNIQFFWNILFHQSKSHDKSLTAWAGQPLVHQGHGG